MFLVKEIEDVSLPRGPTLHHRSFSLFCEIFHTAAKSSGTEMPQNDFGANQAFAPINLL